MDHLSRADELIVLADTTIDSEASGRLASRATAHYLRALYDLISGDREDEIEEANRRIADLESQLEGCRNALRQRDAAMAASTKQDDRLNEQADHLNELAMQYRKLHPDYEPTGAELSEWERDKEGT